MTLLGLSRDCWFKFDHSLRHMHSSVLHRSEYTFPALVSAAEYHCTASGFLRQPCAPRMAATQYGDVDGPSDAYLGWPHQRKLSMGFSMKDFCQRSLLLLPQERGYMFTVRCDHYMAWLLNTPSLLLANAHNARAGHSHSSGVDASPQFQWNRFMSCACDAEGDLEWMGSVWNGVVPTTPGLGTHRVCGTSSSLPSGCCQSKWVAEYSDKAGLRMCYA